MSGIHKELASTDYVNEATSTTIPVSKGGTGYTSIVDTTYTVERYRASALVETETDPTSNGAITWTYE